MDGSVLNIDILYLSYLQELMISACSMFIYILYPTH